VPVSFFYEGGENNAKREEVESLLFTDASLRLLRACRSIKDVRLRRNFVTLIEAIAELGREFDEPIALPDGRELRTLLDAKQYIQALRASQRIKARVAKKPTEA
jgi:hypothetical protein